MKTPREEALAEGIKNRLIGILKSQEVFKGFAEVDGQNLKITEQKIEAFSTAVAAKIDRWYVATKPSPPQITKRLEEEINKFFHEK
jgi:hypothetical protein